MNNRKSRKPLGDALAHQFVYGTDKSELTIETTTEELEELSSQEEPHNDKPAPTSQSTKPTLMSQLQTAAKEPTVRFTVDMSESMHRKLSVLAAKTGRKKADIVRLLLDEALKDVEI